MKQKKVLCKKTKTDRPSDLSVLEIAGYITGLITNS
jgi:hypothetical protein